MIVFNLKISILVLSLPKKSENPYNLVVITIKIIEKVIHTVLVTNKTRAWNLVALSSRWVPKDEFFRGLEGIKPIKEINYTQQPIFYQ